MFKSINLFKELESIGLTERIQGPIIEIGVYKPSTCSSLDFIQNKNEVILVEADPECTEELTTQFGDLQNVKIITKAIWNECKELIFFRTNASAFAREVGASPAKVNDNYIENLKDQFKADAILFSDIDPGNLDLVLIDVEGAEWEVLSHMKSRPLAISLEMRASIYKNPNKDKIIRWLENEGYWLWCHNDTDSIFCRSDVQISLLSKLKYFIHNTFVNIDQNIKFYKKSLRKKLK